VLRRANRLLRLLQTGLRIDRLREIRLRWVLLRLLELGLLALLLLVLLLHPVHQTAHL
jgi:hypothetical protein